MKGFNTKTRYQTKLLLAISALALFYDSPGWSFSSSVGAGAWMFLKGKKESVKNLWWMVMSVATALMSLILALSFYMWATIGYEVIFSPDQCHLIQQCLACTLFASIVSSVFSEKADALDSAMREEQQQQNSNKKKTTTLVGGGGLVKKQEEPQKPVVEKKVEPKKTEPKKEEPKKEEPKKEEPKPVENKAETLPPLVDEQ